MKVRTLFFSILSVSIISMAAIAAGPGRPMRPAGAGLGTGPGHGIERLTAYLGLSEAQVTQWNAIRESTRAQLLPLAEQRRANRDALRAELENAPNAQSVGELVIANHRLREQSRAIHESAQEQFVAILTTEQAEKYENFLEIKKNRRGRGRGVGRGFGPGGGVGPGSGD